MPMPIHMTIEGANQGAIDGPSQMTGREGSFLIQALDHQVRMPRSTQTGLSTGKRIHEPLRVTKFLDVATPKLYLALTTGEHMTVTLKWYRPHPMGGAAEEHYFTTVIEEAMLVSIQDGIPNVLDDRNTNFEHMETLAFSYRRITWTYEPDGVENSDDWHAPVEA